MRMLKIHIIYQMHFSLCVNDVQSEYFGDTEKYTSSSQLHHFVFRMLRVE